MVQQAIVLTKKGLWYKQMLDTRRSELRKAESEVCFPYVLKLFTSLHSFFFAYSPAQSDFSLFDMHANIQGSYRRLMLIHVSNSCI
jgi:hypothetical protein